MAKILAELSDVSVGYLGTPIIKDLSLKICANDFIAMVGPNGSGKTTIMKSILGILPLIKGRRQLFGKSAYIPQKMVMNRLIPLSVKDFLKLKSSSVSTHNIKEALKTVELSGIENESIHKLSGGQLQRVQLAFALLGGPDLIFLDEAAEGMDIKAEKSFYHLIKELLKGKDSAVLLISHDISAVTEHATRVVCVDRKILFDGDPSSPDFHSCLHKIYGDESIIHGHSH